MSAIRIAHTGKCQITVDGVSLTCVAYDGGDDGGISCDWESWHDAHDGYASSPSPSPSPSPSF